jgi:hypothetical protein
MSIPKRLPPVETPPDRPCPRCGEAGSRMIHTHWEDDEKALSYCPEADGGECLQWICEKCHRESCGCDE